MKPEHITLYFKQGTSDKVYQMHLVEEGSGWVVNYANGKRGSTLHPGTKMKNGPVPFDVAKKKYEAVLREKLKEGYTPGEDGSPYTFTPLEERATGVFPMLLVMVDEVTADLLIQSHDFVAEEKFDGERVLIQKKGETVIGINRDGLQRGIPEVVVETVKKLSGDFILDGEMVGEVYNSFDILEIDDPNNTDIPQQGDLRNHDWIYRHMALMTLMSVFPDNNGVIRVAPVAVGAESKRKLFELARKTRREGIVFKRVTAKYTPGRPSNKLNFEGGIPSNADYFKYKFTSTATVQVAKVNTKRSVKMAMLDESGNTVSVGNVTIQANMPIPKQGDYIEVRYLYAYRGGSLYQPVYLGERTDKHVSDGIETLKYKREESEE